MVKKGYKELVDNFQSDLIAAVSVSLIALPLSLGIALAAGAPAMSGILSAVVGGVVTTIYRGGHISINGPAKGVIAVILLGIALMDDGSGQAFNYILAAIVVSGAIQMILGLLKLGRLADIFHPSVINGILAAIGIIIFAKQIHVALGTSSESVNIVQNLIDAFLKVPREIFVNKKNINQCYLDVNIDLTKRKVTLSIKLLEEIDKKEALEKYGSEGSGKNLPFSSLSEDLKKKEEKKE